MLPLERGTWGPGHKTRDVYGVTSCIFQLVGVHGDFITGSPPFDFNSFHLYGPPTCTPLKFMFFLQVLLKTLPSLGNLTCEYCFPKPLSPIRHLLVSPLRSSLHWTYLIIGEEPRNVGVIRCIPFSLTLSVLGIEVQC